MSFSAAFSTTASLLADPARAMMLAALFDGGAWPAGELAYAAGVTPQTASSHLAKLVAGGLLAVEREGRHRYYRLANTDVAQALEQLSILSPDQPVRRRRLSAEAREMRFCRCCYDHLAGQVGVAVSDALLERGYLVAVPDKRYEVTVTGAAWFAHMGIDVAELRPTRRGIARQCIDWTERRYHLAGPLGERLLSVLCASGWMRRAPSSRLIEVTPKGWTGLRRELGLERSAILVASETREATAGTAQPRVLVVMA
jgi:DNA-binding transcriptional ArsR family regulator